MSGKKCLESLVDAHILVSAVGQEPLRLEADSTFRISVQVQNAGSATYSWSAQNPLHLAYRWIRDNDEVVEWDGDRSSVSMPLEQGSIQTIETSGASPGAEGSYRLLVSLVLENVHWACDVSGTGWASLRVDVTAAPAWPAHLEASPGGKALRGAIAASSLKRLLQERPIDAHAIEPAPEIVEIVAASPVAVVDTKRKQRKAPAWLRRLRASLRHLLGIPEMRDAVEALLRRSADQQEQIAHLNAELAELPRFRQQLLAETNAIERQLADSRDLLSELQISVANQQAELLRSAVELRELGGLIATARTDLVRELGGLMNATRDDLVRELGGLTNTARTDLLRELRSGETISDALESLRNLDSFREHVGELTLIRSVAESVDQLPQIVADEAARARSQISEELRGSDVTVELLSSLRQLAAWSRDSDLQRLGDTIERLPGLIGDAAVFSQQRLLDALSGSDLVAELLSSLRQLSAWAGQSDLHRLGLIKDAVERLPSLIDAAAAESRSQVIDELRGGALVVELVSTLRQVAEWTQHAADVHLIGTIDQKLSQFARDSDLAAGRQLPYLDRLQVHASSTSAKLDALMTRETIPLASAGLVLSRSRFGFLAIQDRDLAAISYYSSGELPERGTIAVVEGVLRPGDVFLDVGANVGAYTMIGARIVGSAGKVIAVEPVPSTFRMLQVTTAINGISDLVELHECALGAERGQVTVYAGPTSGHSSLLVPTALSEKFEVAMKTGADLLGKRKPRLIKVDVEGWELDVLDGLTPLVHSSRQLAVIVECSPSHIERRGMTVGEWIERLRALGKEIWIIADDPPALKRLTDASDIGPNGANLFLSSKLPATLRAISQ